MKSPHHQTAFSIVTSHGDVLLDDEPLDGLIEDIASALQNAFDLGFKAAGGSIYPLNEDPSGQHREPMLPHPVDGEALSKAIVRLREYVRLLDVDVFADDNEPNLQEDIELVCAAAQLALMGDADLTHYEADAESVLAASQPPVGGEALANRIENGPDALYWWSGPGIGLKELTDVEFNSILTALRAQPASPLRGRELADKINQIFYDWLTRFEHGDPILYTPAREYAADALRDCRDLILAAIAADPVTGREEIQ